MLAPKIARSAGQTKATAEPASRATADGRAALRLTEPGFLAAAGDRHEDPRPQEVHPPDRAADFSAVPVFAADRAGRPRLRAPSVAAMAVAGTVQPKLAVGRVDDPLERAAEFDATAAEDAYQVISGPGQALEGSAREFFEPRFGYDFSRVRVHADPRAAASARALGARAYTVGANIVFGPGRYQPGSESGRRLLAHELAHVRQQGMAPRTAHAGSVQRQPDAGTAGTQRQPDAGTAGPSPDGGTGTKAFNLILQHEFPVVSSSWFAGTTITLPAGGGVRADLKTGRNGQVLFDLSPDFAPAGRGRRLRRPILVG